MNLKDGNTEFVYTDVVDSASKIAGKKVSIPDEFTIKIPVFGGIDQPLYEFQARFRHRLVGGQLSIWYELIRPRKVLEQAYKDLLAKISKATGKPVLFGSPE